jgi:hypothetical protein
MGRGRKAKDFGAKEIDIFVWAFLDLEMKPKRLERNDIKEQKGWHLNGQKLNVQKFFVLLFFNSGKN